MKRLWLVLAAVVVLSFAVLGWIGTRIYHEAPPIPERVVTTEGTEVFGPGQIRRGQNVWQAMGGMEVGSVWGHGSYVAPDWTADWLHREAVFVLNEWARQEGAATYEQLSAERQSALRGRLQQLYRMNTYDPATGILRIEPVRARAIESCIEYYTQLLMHGNEAYAIPAGAVRDRERMRDLAAFFF
jgi:nitric oxide reductase subunit B